MGLGLGLRFNDPTLERGCKSANTRVFQGTESPSLAFSTALVAPCQPWRFPNRCPAGRSSKTSGTWSVRLERRPGRRTAVDLKAQGSKTKVKKL